MHHTTQCHNPDDENMDNEIRYQEKLPAVKAALCSFLVNSNWHFLEELPIQVFCGYFVCLQQENAVSESQDSSDTQALKEFLQVNQRGTLKNGYLVGCGQGWHSRYSHSLQARWSGNHISVGPRFSAPVQTGPGAHPASYTMGTGSFAEVKQPGLGTDHLPQSSAEVKERVELYLYSPSGPSWPVLGWTLTLLSRTRFILYRKTSADTKIECGKKGQRGDT